MRVLCIWRAKLWWAHLGLIDPLLNPTPSHTNPPTNPNTGPLQPAASYGADMAGTLFQGDASGWNLSKLDNMIKLLPDDLPGITTAMLYFGACCLVVRGGWVGRERNSREGFGFGVVVVGSRHDSNNHAGTAGMWRAMFAFHTEDMNLYR